MEELISVHVVEQLQVWIPMLKDVLGSTLPYTWRPPIGQPKLQLTFVYCSYADVGPSYLGLA